MNILLIVTGGIAAYKTPEFVRLCRKKGHSIRCILTNAAKHFVTPFALATVSENPVYDDLWSLKDETEIGHIRLSREADCILIAPATANMIGKMANGLADDLASAVLLAANKPIFIAPAMNPQMWSNFAVQKNVETLKKQGMTLIGPDAGDMACHETGTGRMCEPSDILETLEHYFSNPSSKALSNKKVLVTAGPTVEAIDPVRFISNISSGKQGYAIAQAFRDYGADVTLISGPVKLPPPY